MPAKAETKQTLSASVLPDQTIVLEWIATRQYMSGSRNKLEADVYTAYTSRKTGDWLLLVGFCDKGIPLSAPLAFFRQFAGDFAEAVCNIPEIEELRENVAVDPDAAAFDRHLENLPPMPGAEYVDRSFLHGLWQKLHEAFAGALQSWSGTVAEYIRRIRPDAQIAGRVFFHLVENTRTDDPFAFLATYSTGPDSGAKSRHVPLKHALEAYKDSEDELYHLLATVYRAAEKSELVRELIDSGDLFHPLFWSSKKAYEFLKEVPIYEAAGILCRIPNWWKAKSAAVQLNLQIGDTGPSFVGLDSLVSFKPKLLIGDEEISADEARRLLEEAEGLAFIKNKWVAVDPKRLEQTLAAYEKAEAIAEKGGLSLKEAMQLQMNPEKALGEEPEEAGYAIAQGQWLKGVLQRLRRPEQIPQVAPSTRFKAELRPYQHEGLNWLYFHYKMGFGACLADDMGLGKTVEVLALLDVLKHNGSGGENRGKKADLLIVPASLVSNWAEEIERFFPDLVYLAAHPALQQNKRMRAKDESTLDTYDLVITTYGLIQRYDWLKDYPWRYVILDEAQAIKNSATKQTRAVKHLSAQNRIILTGTPIENRLSDLWSLFDFLNPGLLGTATEFKSYMKQLDKGEKDHAGLRRLVRPFILRRLKTDRDVIDDLPEKVEMKSYAQLTQKQYLLYQRLVDNLTETIETAEGIERKGLVLSSLMKFKQICNHPDQYLGAQGFDEAASGKFSRLRQICETIHEKRERVLVFTQFREMVGPLAGFLEQIFGRPGLFIHGGVAVGKRKKRVQQFQADAYTPFMVLSLKTGGVGLNLTRAGHVVHFDRWWNPAVENQATDRAFRIGQKKNVMVHKFLTQGTVEEKIDRMLSSKQSLAEDVIGNTGEAWITEMDNQELIDTFRLGL
ncbi:MAG: DEAD/DEAH box helicase [bacterium]